MIFSTIRGMKTNQTRFDVAIVLVTYNYHQDTVACVQSIAKSSGVQLPFVLVVDNSTKEKFDESALNFYPHHAVITTNANLGFGKANNLGVDWLKQHIQTTYTFLLNNDTLLKSDTLRILLDSYPQDPAVVVVTPTIYTDAQPALVWYGGGRFKLWKMSVSMNHFGRTETDARSGYVSFASGCAMLFRSTFLAGNQLFDPNLFMYDEDVELCLRLRKANARIWRTAESVVIHKCQGSQSTSAESSKLSQLHPDHPGIKFYLGQTVPNRYYILRRHFSGFAKGVWSITLTSYWILKAVQYLAENHTDLAAYTLRQILSGLSERKPEPFSTKTKTIACEEIVL